MTHEELQELIDAIDLSVNYVPPEYEQALKAVSNLLVDLPDEAVESLELRSEQV